MNVNKIEPNFFKTNAFIIEIIQREKEEVYTCFEWSRMFNVSQERTRKVLYDAVKEGKIGKYEWTKKVFYYGSLEVIEEIKKREREVYESFSTCNTSGAEKEI